MKVVVGHSDIDMAMEIHLHATNMSEFYHRTIDDVFATNDTLEIIRISMQSCRMHI